MWSTEYRVQVRSAEYIGVRGTEYGVRSTEYGVYGVQSTEYGVRSTSYEYGVRSMGNRLVLVLAMY